MSAFVWDADGEKVRAGDAVRFSYGIPPVGVVAQVVEDGGELWILTPGHNPERSKLAALRKNVGCFYKEETK